jgi:deferrochelatase/peroxidase EfeB
MSRLSGAVSTVDEVHGFNYFDDRDLIGFVDGTENPVEQAAVITCHYLSHSETVVRLYFQETFTFLLLTTEAAVVLAPSEK